MDCRIYEDPIACMLRRGRIGFEVIHFSRNFIAGFGGFLELSGWIAGFMKIL